MKKIILTLSTITMIASAAMIACNSSNTPSTKNEGIAEAPSEGEMIERGNYLVTIMGCNDCHTPKKMGPGGPELDSSRLLSGHPAEMPVAKADPSMLKDWVGFTHTLTAAAGPWGTSFAANLTSDETGIGNWSEEQFFTAIRQGKFKGAPAGRDLLPPMPWQMYRNATDEDLKAIFTYLKSTRPVRNLVPSPIPPAQQPATN